MEFNNTRNERNDDTDDQENGSLVGFSILAGAFVVGGAVLGGLLFSNNKQETSYSTSTLRTK